MSDRVRFTMTITMDATDGSEVAESGLDQVLRGILRETARKISDTGSLSGVVRDASGNEVGTWQTRELRAAPVARPSGKAYSQADVMERAFDLGGNWRKCNLYLNAGDSAWYPGSAKKQYIGPGWVTYMIHPSSIETYGHADNPAKLVYKS